MVKDFLQKAARVVVLSALAAGTFSLALAWTGPTAAPPGNNTAAPINTSSTPQVKSGPFQIYDPTSNYTSHTAGLTLGYYSGYGYIQSPSAGGGVHIWDTTTNDIVSFNDNHTSTFAGTASAPDFCLTAGRCLSQSAGRAFGGAFSVWDVGGCQQVNDIGGSGCGCPGWAPSVEGLSNGTYGGSSYNTYLCYK